MNSGHVAVRRLRAGYGEETVLDLEQLEVQPGEFLSVLGPSGCGKTTLLNTIAGFVHPQEGQVIIDGTDVTNVLPHKRNLGLVFQNYALFPHLTVEQNLTYGLKVRKVDAATRRHRVDEVLRLVSMGDFAARRPHQLSGGQQQRIALARALAYEPDVLLLDEPLSNLDAKLRRQMQTELRQIQRRVGTTMIFVTHDQNEALSLSDRVVLLNAGTVEQIGTPEQIYRRPHTAFVADFLGAGNLLETTVTSPTTAMVDGMTIPVDTSLPAGSEALVVVRREDIRVDSNPISAKSGSVPRGIVAFRAFSGNSWHLQIQLTSTVVIDVDARSDGGDFDPPEEGDEVTLRWSPQAATVIST